MKLVRSTAEIATIPSDGQSPRSNNILVDLIHLFNFIIEEVELCHVPEDGPSGWGITNDDLEAVHTLTISQPLTNVDLLFSAVPNLVELKYSDRFDKPFKRLSVYPFAFTLLSLSLRSFSEQEYDWDLLFSWSFLSLRKFQCAPSSLNLGGSTTILEYSKRKPLLLCVFDLPLHVEGGRLAGRAVIVLQNGEMLGEESKWFDCLSEVPLNTEEERKAMMQKAKSAIGIEQDCADKE